MLPASLKTQIIIQSTERLMAESLEVLGKIHRGLAQNEVRIERARAALRQSLLLLRDEAEHPPGNATSAEGPDSTLGETF